MSVNPFNNNPPKRWKMTPESNQKESNRKQSTFAWFYNSKAWKTARNKCLQKNPVCDMCHQDGILTSARTVNHITPLRVIVQSGATSINTMLQSEFKSATSLSNLESLCLTCHGIEESEMIKREKQQLAEKEKETRKVQREKKRLEIVRRSREPKHFDNFNHAIYTDENGEQVFLQIF
jgi:5-methylcytosine-specific restriction endonuclease McrA